MINLEKILCPVDFSAVSDDAVDYAATLAKLYEASVHLLHVVSPIFPTFGSIKINTSHLTHSARVAATDQLYALRKRLKHEDVITEFVVRVGKVYEEIKTAIEAFKPDLLVIGTHGRRGIDRWFMGSTAQQLLRHSPVPIVTISAGGRRSRSRHPFRKILVTTDFSEGTPEALSFAFSLAQENQSKITLLHVINDAAVDLSVKYRKKVLSASQRQLEDLVPAGARDWSKVLTRIETGTPYKEILKILKANKMDLLVMNIHGKGMLDRVLIGSTAERVVRGAQCPVMLIPPRGRRLKG